MSAELPAAQAAAPARAGAPYWMESARLRRYPVAVAAAVGRFLAGGAA